MTINKPEVVAIIDDHRASGILFVSVNGSERPPNGTQLIRLIDYEALEADRNQQYDMKVKAREQRDKVTAELKTLQAKCEKMVDMLEVFVDNHGYSSYLSEEEKEAVPEVREARELMDAYRKQGGESWA